jgi:hypothetical protein
MYARLGPSRIDTSDPQPKKQYSKLSDLYMGNNYLRTDNKKFVVSPDIYNKEIVNSYKKDFETQFFDKIKVPEQAKFIQRPIAKDGR